MTLEVRAIVDLFLVSWAHVAACRACGSFDGSETDGADAVTGLCAFATLLRPR